MLRHLLPVRPDVDRSGPLGRCGALVLSLAVATALLAGCGSEEGATASTTSASTTTAAAEGSLDPETLALIEDCGAGDRILTAADVPLDPAQTVLVRDTEGNALCLGPEGMAGDGVDSAEAALDIDGEWAINLVLNGPGLERFNQVAELCFIEAPDPDQCPSGRVALLVEADVLSSPTIDVRSFLGDDLVISGEFSQDEAESLASQIESGQLSVRPVLADLGAI